MWTEKKRGVSVCIYIVMSNEEGLCSTSGPLQSLKLCCSVAVILLNPPAFTLRRETRVLCVLDIFPLASNIISSVQRRHRWCEITRSHRCRLRTLSLTKVSLKPFSLASITFLLPFTF